MTVYSQGSEIVFEVLGVHNSKLDLPDDNLTGIFAYLTVLI